MSMLGDRIARWFGYEPSRPRFDLADPIGEHLRAAVTADAEAKAENTRSYDARVQSMFDDLFLRMKERDGRHHA